MMNKTTKILTVLLLGIFLFSCSKEERKITNTFSYDPTSLQSGKEVTIYFLPDSTQLAGSDKVNAVVYEYNVLAEKVTEVPMRKTNNYFRATYTPSQETKGLLIKFKSGKKEDTNRKHGYIIYMTDGRGNLLPGAEAGLAAAYVAWGRNVGLDNLITEGLKLFSEDFTKNPGVKEKYLNNYFYALWRNDRKTASEIITKELNDLEKKENKTEDDYKTLKKWYGTLGIQDKANKYTKEGSEKYPKSEFAKSVQFDNFRQAQTPEEKDKLLAKFKEDFPNDDLLNGFYEDYAYFYIQKGNFANVYNFFAKNKSFIHPFYFDYTAQKMIEGNYDPGKVEEMYKWGITRGRKMLDEPPKESAKFLTDEEVRKENNYYLALNLLGYCKILYDKGEKDKAIPLLEEGVEKSKDFNSNPDMNLLYAKALLETGNNDRAMTVIEEFVKGGNGSEEMIALMKKAYTAKNGNDKGFKEYVSKYEAAAKEEIIKTLKDEMVNDPAPDFKLKDLEGKTVTLANMKGTAFVLDFWATWCGPCKKSFPGMQKAVDFYKDDDNVKLLFVNTWERVDNKIKNAKDFIKKNKYSFHVLMDTENKAVTDYKVSGIPTKFIVDKNGHIRFKSVGFSGDTHKMFEEIIIMIDMIK